jgi:Mannosylglycerate hydrolase MGH1-like glycoside hydrolase domain/Glycosyl hydrolase family 63 C-terminal domain
MADKKVNRRAKRAMSREEVRLQEDRERKANWKRWGPYLSERQWGTVREDYSAYGTAWDYLPHDHARSRAYRWGEDGLGGICDRHQYICFALALWNGQDPILKERLFGLTGSEGNHGEDVKEYYYYLDSTPTHSYMKFLYKYPQREFPYGRLAEENRKRGKRALEFELIDTGVFDDDRYFDIIIEYAKAGPEDILIRIEAFNRGPEAAELHLLPTLWFRNTWSWGLGERKPKLHRDPNTEVAALKLDHFYYGSRWFYFEGNPNFLFTENETNKQRLFNDANDTPHVKDSINDFVVHGAMSAVNPDGHGTKGAGHYTATVPSGGKYTVRLRLSAAAPSGAQVLNGSFDSQIHQRQEEADEFYRTVVPESVSEDRQNIMRQALGGLLWSKQFYHYDLNRWLKGDPAGPEPPRERLNGRNHEWRHLYNADVISMPDKWEYPWYAAWDLAFHCIALALVDADFAKDQLLLMTREWYMHPNGQLPAYEWAFGDVNPPVHAWAAWRVYKVEMKRRGEGDRKFLERIFQKLLLNFTWWVNRKDAEGRNVFQGGFLGLDNIGVFDRSAPLPTGGHLEQSDGTSWMGMYCLNMLAIALELAKENSAYEDVASKFFEHFVYICEAMNNLGGQKIELWDRDDGFYYDVLHHENGQNMPLKIRSMVGLIPLFAVETLDPETVDKLPGFKRRMQWFIENRPALSDHIETETTDDGPRRFLSLVNRHRLKRVLSYMLDENEFLSSYGIRALSRFHRDHPYELRVNGSVYRVDYEPAESSTGLFGGNSNWRGPIWFPVNYLLIESLQKFHFFLGDHYKIECPTGSGVELNLWQIAGEISQRLTRIFTRDENGRRPVFGGTEKFQRDPHWRDLIPFHEYFHGDNGAGIGASHQTGWTALVAKLMQQYGE